MKHWCNSDITDEILEHYACHLIINEKYVFFFEIVQNFPQVRERIENMMHYCREYIGA